MKKNGGWRAIATALALMVGGCSTMGPRSVLIVSNSGDSPIADVDLQFEGGMKYSQSAIAPHSDGDYKAVKEKLPATSLVRWKDTKGNVVTKSVKMDKPLADDFRGRVFFQIDNSSEVKVFVMPESGDGAQLIPWGNSGNWDPTVAIPGFNQQ